MALAGWPRRAPEARASPPATVLVAMVTLGTACIPWLPAAADAPGAATLERPRIELVEVDGRLAIEVLGLREGRLAELENQQPTAVEWPRVFAVYTRAASVRADELPPLLGGYALTATGVRFTPRFALVPGQSYVAVWHGLDAGDEISTVLAVAALELDPSTLVTGIYPSTEVVPENLLRLYVEFSAPMSRGSAARHIRLLDEDGRELDGPFVAPERELWSPDRTRLTLFFDPGRIKRGVGPNAEVGPPLREGGRYRLEIDREMADGRGAPLALGHRHEFRVAAPDRDSPSTEGWRLEPPSGPLEPVSITFPEPLDRGLLEGLLEVLDAGGASLAGAVAVGPGETRWSFRPERPWGEEVYRVRVAAQLEDLAGNSLLRPFEIALAGGTASTDRPRYIELPFSMR